MEDLEDPRGGSNENGDLQNFVGVSSGILNWDSGFDDDVRVHSELSADSKECCWMPTPKGFGGSWLFSSRDVFDKKW